MVIPRISKQLVPPKGWYFEQGKFTIKGETFNDLVKNVTEHRKSNGMPAGNPDFEIQEQYCEVWPAGCLSRMISSVKVFASFAEALWSYVTSGGQLVSQNDANVRAEICVNCHNNIQSSDARKGVCCGGVTNLILDQTKKRVIGDRKTAYDKLLKACAICGCENALQIWFPTSSLGMSKDNVNAYPTPCWRKKI